MKIIQALPEHINPVMKLILAAIEDMAVHGLDQWNENYPSRSILEQDIREQTLFLLTDKNDLRGQIVLNEHQDEEYKAIPWLHNDAQVLVIHRLCIHPAWRGQGYAALLMDFAEKMAVNKHYTSIRLDAYTANAAATTLYEKRGYEKIGQVQFSGRKYPFNCYEKLF